MQCLKYGFYLLEFVVVRQRWVLLYALVQPLALLSELRAFVWASSFQRSGEIQEWHRGQRRGSVFQVTVAL